MAQFLDNYPSVLSNQDLRCYYEYLWNYLVFENPFTEWLAVGERELRVNRFLSDSLALNYLKPKLTQNIYQNFDKKPETLCFIQLLSFLDQRTQKIQILERCLGFIKIQFQLNSWLTIDGIIKAESPSKVLVVVNLFNVSVNENSF